MIIKNARVFTEAVSYTHLNLDDIVEEERLGISIYVRKN